MSIELRKSKVFLLCHFDNEDKNVTVDETGRVYSHYFNSQNYETKIDGKFGLTSQFGTGGSDNGGFTLNVSDIFPKGDFTVQFWCQKGGRTSDAHLTNNNGNGYAFKLQKFVGLRHYSTNLRAEDMNGTVSSTYWKTITTDSWHHFCIQWHEDTLTFDFFYDGVWYASRTVSSRPALSNMYFGATTIDEFLVYDGIMYDTTDKSLNDTVFEVPSEPFEIAKPKIITNEQVEELTNALVQKITTKYTIATDEDINSIFDQ